MSAVTIPTECGFDEITVRDFVPATVQAPDSRVGLIWQRRAGRPEQKDTIEIASDQLDALIVALQDIQAKITIQEAHKKWLHTAVFGGRYRHKKGNVYEVSEFTVDTDTDATRVTYFAVSNPNIRYSRRREEFEDGRFTRIQIDEGADNVA